MVTNRITYGSAIEKIEDGAQVEFPPILPFLELELGYVRDQFLVRTFSVEVSCQYIFSDVLRLGLNIYTKINFEGGVSS